MLSRGWTILLDRMATYLLIAFSAAYMLPFILTPVDIVDNYTCSSQLPHTFNPDQNSLDLSAMFLGNLSRADTTNITRSVAAIAQSYREVARADAFRQQAPLVEMLLDVMERSKDMVAILNELESEAKDIVTNRGVALLSFNWMLWQLQLHSLAVLMRVAFEEMLLDRYELKSYHEDRQLMQARAALQRTLWFRRVDDIPQVKELSKTDKYLRVARTALDDYRVILLAVSRRACEWQRQTDMIRVGAEHEQEVGNVVGYCVIS